MKTGPIVVAAVAAGLILPAMLTKLGDQYGALVQNQPQSNASSNPSEERQTARVERGGDEGEHRSAPSFDEADEDSDDNDFALATATRDNRGHFSFTASMNGADVEVLVDTGASAVAINRTTAEEIGVYVDDGNKSFQVNTANGKATAYKAVIDEIIIDEIVVTDVSAFVLEDEALSGTLLGMSFLSKLDKFEIEGETLTLIQ